MSAYSEVRDIIEIILASVGQEAKVRPEYLSVEVESVVTRGVLEAFKRGGESIHERDTEPPPEPEPRLRKPTPRIPFSIAPIPKVHTPSYGTPRPRIPTPVVRKKDPRRDEE